MSGSPSVIRKAIFLAILSTTWAAADAAQAAPAARKRSAPATSVEAAILNEGGNEGAQADESQPSVMDEGLTPALGGTLVGFGPGWFSALNTSNVAYVVSAASMWDARWMQLGLGSDFAFSGNAAFVDAALRANVFILRGETSPYVGAKFGLGLAKQNSSDGFFSGEYTGGFVVGGTLGVQTLRTSTIRLDLGVNVTAVTTANIEGVPLLTSLLVSLFF